VTEPLLFYRGIVGQGGCVVLLTLVNLASYPVRQRFEGTPFIVSGSPDQGCPGPVNRSSFRLIADISCLGLGFHIGPPSPGALDGRRICRGVSSKRL